MLDSTCPVCCRIWGVKAKDLIAVFGSVEAVRHLWPKPLTRSAIYQWMDGDGDVPELRAYQLHEMFPDINKRIRAAHKAKEQKAA